MPHAFPAHIKDYLKNNLPPTHLMWWMRCQIIEIEKVILRPVTSSGTPLPIMHYFRFTLRDVDATKDDKSGYIVDVLAGENSDFRVEDRVSLFGHEPIGKTYSSVPRFLYDHENEQSAPCYETKYIDHNSVPAPSLKVSVPGSAREKGAKVVTGFLKKLNRDTEMVEGTLPGGINLRPLYLEASDEINKHVKSVKDENFPCINPRFGPPGGGSKLPDW